jgi:hypothetical protein
MSNCKVVKVQILSDKRLNTTIKKQKSLNADGSWSKNKLEDHLKRPRNTINQWDRLLISLSDVLPDYERLRKTGRLNDYHRFVLEQISRFQNRQSPWRTMTEIENFVTRNADKLTLLKYMKQFTGV